MYLFYSLTTALLLIGSSIGITGHTSDLVAANLRSPSPNAAAIEPRRVDEIRLGRKRKDDASLSLSNHVAVVIPRAPQDGEPPPAPKPATIAKPPSAPTEPEAPAPVPEPPSAPTEPEGPQSPAQKQPQKQDSDDDDDDDDDDSDSPDTPEQPKSKNESGDSEGDGEGDTESGGADNDDDNVSSSSSGGPNPTCTANARCISTATLPPTTMKAAVSTPTSASTLAPTTTALTVQELAPASTTPAPTTSPLTAAAAGIEAQNPFAWVKRGPKGCGGRVATTFGAYAIACLVFRFWDRR